jgi:hypothetical protein
VEEIYHEAPVIEMEIVFRLQRLASLPDATQIAGVAPLTSPRLGSQQLSRDSISSETITTTNAQRPTDHAAEIVYQGAYELSEETLADGTNATLDQHFGSLGGWVASTLVKLGDLQFVYLPADDDK